MFDTLIRLSLYFLLDPQLKKKPYRVVLLVINSLIFILILSPFWTQELYLHTRSSIRGERRSLPSWTCRGLELPVQILARCANPSLIHTNLAFTSILTHATPAYKAEIITFVHKIKLYVYFEKLSCLLRERNGEKERVRKRERVKEITPLCNTLLVMCMKCLHRIKVYIYLSGN